MKIMPLIRRPLGPGYRPAAAVAIAAAAGFLAAAGCLQGAAHFVWIAGLGPYGATPLWVAGSLSLALGALAGRILRPGGGIGLARKARRTPARLPAAAAAALLLGGLHALLVPRLAAGFGRSFIALERAPGAATAGLWAEVVLALALLGPPLCVGGLLAAILSARRAALATGLLGFGAGCAALLLAEPLLHGPPGLPLGTAIGLLLLAAPSWWAFGARGPRLPSAADRPGNIPAAPTGNRAVALALLSVAASAALAMLFAALARAVCGIVGPERLPGLLPAALLLPLGVGACAVSFMSVRPEAPWRLIGRGLALAGLAGLLATAAAGSLPGAYLRTLARAGLTPSGEWMALAVVCALALAAPALLVGVVAGATAASGAAAASLPLLAAGVAAGMLLLPVAVGALGLPGTLLLSGTLLAVLGAFLILLEAGSLRGRGLWSLGALAACSFIVLEIEPWDRLLATSAVAHHPALYLEEARPVLGKRLARDRLLLYREGPRVTAAIKLLDGRSQALVAQGRLQVLDSLEARRGLALAAHLPALLGPDGGRALLLAPPTWLTYEALLSHGAFEISAAAGEPALEEVSLAAGWIQGPGEAVAPAPGPRPVRAGARRVLALEQEGFDLILAPPLASEGDLLRLSSERTLALARERLRAGGVICLSVPLRGLTREGLLGTIRRFRRIFPGASLWTGGSQIFLVGGDAPIRPDVDRIGSRSLRPGVAESLAALGLDDPLKMVALSLAESEEDAPEASAGERDLRASAVLARLRPSYAENLRWIASRIESEEAAPLFPETFGEPARESAERRLRVLRQVLGRTLRARAALVEGEPERALEAAEEAITGDPSDIEARGIAARALASLGDDMLDAGERLRAAAAYRRALALDPRSLEALTALAWLRYTQGDAAGAAGLLRRALQVAPWVALLHHRLGLALLEVGDPAAAEASLLRAHDLNPRRAGTLLLLGDAARARGDSRRALALYERALAVGGAEAMARAARAAIHLESGELGAAKAELEAALRAKPSDPGALLMRARLRATKGEWEGARRDLLAAVAAGGSVYRARAMLEPALRDLLPERGSTTVEE